ncbi:MAG: DUF1127 domain-containing protein [Hyphomicrobiales bacterium]|nr:DUF1127 domain-containing protein [Hyphomicrobiales bacterium]
MTRTVAASRDAHSYSRSNAAHRLSTTVSLVESYLQYRRERRALLALDPYLLKDIGISRAEAERIAHAPFSHWTKR